ncbi:transcriptional regulator, TetR family [Actinacidiphila yanglinensis]|uniref:Transcriptional regulator, TetR family n=1 Tax=Actinacidiphila yanglinensis TaxID=310779 RepID=A0A1H6E644_9ACTN|nr:helix-turn-helix domain-containing protein [Actinacidiphila yanglinensis]SEG92355.1 transcriptional regulator, TetR family [Actinacidiphila yanglinensis]
MPENAAAPAGPPAAPRRLRADAQRNVTALLEAAKTVFDTTGVDAPAKEITDLAGVGVGTLYRHFPQRSDLVKAVVQSNIDACAAAGPRLRAAHEPAAALAAWLREYTELLGTKRGLASALHSGDPAYEALPGYFLETLTPTLTALLDAAAADGEIRDDVAAKDLMFAIAQLCLPVAGESPGHSARMVGILIDGLSNGPRRQGRTAGQ